MNLSEQQLGVLLTHGWWQHVDAVADTALESEPESSLAIAAKGFVCLRDGQTQEARSLFHDALAIDASDIVARIGLFNLYYQDANFPKADELIRNLLLELPNEVGLHAAQCRLSAIFESRERTSEKIRQALSLHPANEELLTIELYHAHKGNDDAHKIELSKNLLRLAPDNLLAHLILGHACIKKRDFDAAEQHLKTCVRRAPSEETARQLELLEAARSGKGTWRLAAWAYRRKMWKLLFPRRHLRERLQLRWQRR
ncbi:MAG TPA: hypothetical protein DEF45_09290 [Rhodopirellula sp.]|nr:hypothetical protein [Rhodopirellula sp.]